MKTYWWRYSALLAILVLAAGLRLWQYDFDPVEGNCPLYHDAWSKFLMANDVAQGRYQPVLYKQPAFLIYTSGFILRVSALFGHTGVEHLWRLVVLYMIVCSVLTVGVTFFIAQVVFASGRLSLLATAFAAVLPVSVVGSRYIKEDVPLALLANLSILFLLLAIQKGARQGISRPRWGGSGLWWYVPAGVCAGLAAATKYAGLAWLSFFSWPIAS